MSNIILPERWWPLKPHPTQYAMFTDPHRFKVGVAGRGSGKTEVAKRKLVRETTKKKPWRDPRYAYLGPTRGQAKRIAWPDIKSLIPPQWIANISESDLCITMINGAELWVIGMDKPQRFEGNQWDGAVIDECSDQKPKMFDLSVRPALTHRKGWCWRIGVPKRTGPGAREFKAAYDKGLPRIGDHASYTWPSSDILTAQENQDIKEALSEKDYNEQQNASWETASGLSFYSFTGQNISKVNYDPDKEIVVGMDFNVSPMAWVLCHRRYGHGPALQQFDEIYMKDTNTRESLDYLAKKYRHHDSKWLFMGDASSRARKTSASHSDYIQIKNDERFKRSRIRFPSSNPPVRDRLASCNGLICSAAGIMNFLIDPRCTNTIADLETRSNSPDGMPNDTDPDSGHATDGLGYIIHSLYPLAPRSMGKAKIKVTNGY